MLNLRIQNPFHSAGILKRYAHASRIAAEGNPVKQAAKLGAVMGTALATIGLYTPFQKLKQSIRELNNPDEISCLTKTLQNYLLPESNLRESLSSQLGIELSPKPQAPIPFLRNLYTMVGTNCDSSEFAVKANNAQRVFYNHIEDPKLRLDFLRMIYRIYREDFLRITNSRLRDNDMNEITISELTGIMSINGYCLNPKLKQLLVNVNVASLKNNELDPLFTRQA